MSPYLKSQVKKKSMQENVKGQFPRQPLSFGASNDTKQCMLMAFPEIDKTHSENPKLKGFRQGPIRPATEGKRMGQGKSEVKPEKNIGRKPNSASRRPPSPNTGKANGILYHND